MSRTQASTVFRRTASLIVCVTAAMLHSGCAARRGPYAPQSEIDRNPLEAQRLNADAAAILEQLNSTEPIPQSAPGHEEQHAAKLMQLARAEALLRDAISADLYCGPAHNNLGIVYLAGSPAKLYEAASEFEWARRLMPGHPDPRVNLAITLERAGKVDDAIASCRAALEGRPGHLPAIQQLARLQLKHRRTDDRTPAYLDEIALRGDPAWSQWARSVMAHR